MNGADYIVIGVLLIVIAVAIYLMRHKKSSCCSCDGNCNKCNRR